MKTSTIIMVVVALIILVGGGWYWLSTQSPVSEPTITDQTSTSTQPVVTNPAQYVEGNLLLGQDATTTLGSYLIAYNGMTLYLYTKDKVASSTCYGQCAVNWPPYVVASTSALSNIQAGIKGKVGSITRTDGTLQVTYKDQPLYFYIADMASGDTTGQNVGKVWFVVKP